MLHADLTEQQRAAYHEHLQSDHDYRVWAEVLTLEEEPVEAGDVTILDGQINVLNNDEGPRRTATLTLSDPESALSFGVGFSEDDKGVLWVNRLLAIHHEVKPPSLGPVETTCFVGVPTAASRTGGEIGLELGDKSLLCDFGRPSVTLRKGMNARAAIVYCLETLTGEKKHRIPTTTRTLSRDYSVGLSLDIEAITTPWRLARLIANNECAWALDFTPDGWAEAVPRDAARDRIPVKHLLDLPNPQIAYDFSNYVKVTGNKVTGIAVLPDEHRLSPYALRRHGVPRYRAMIVDDGALNTTAKVGTRATQELRENSDIEAQQAHMIVPMFHVGNDDVFVMPDGVGEVPFREGSIPLGVGGAMTVGAVRWVSAPVSVSATTTAAKRKKKKKRRRR